MNVIFLAPENWVVLQTPFTSIPQSRYFLPIPISSLPRPSFRGVIPCPWNNGSPAVLTSCPHHLPPSSHNGRASSLAGLPAPTIRLAGLKLPLPPSTWDARKKYIFLVSPSGQYNSASLQQSALGAEEES